MDEQAKRGIGVTGGIACGKSTVAEILASANFYVIDTDQIAHRLMEPDQVNWKNIVDVFGRDVLNSDRTINRKVLGDLVFGNDSLRKKLNTLTHPAIQQEWKDERSQFQKSNPSGNLVVVIPLLFEVALEGEFDQILCVGCSRETQLARLESRGWNREQALQRVQGQSPLAEKMRRSHAVLWNEGTVQALERQVQVWLTLNR